MKPEVLAFIALLFVGGAAVLLRRRVEFNEPGTAAGFSLANMAEEAGKLLGGVAVTDQAARNLEAFLEAIRWAEGTDDDQGWRALFGHTKRRPLLFDSFLDHPRIRTYEAFDGQFIKNGKIDYTTAAGAYQITETTYNRLARKLRLAGFSPDIQRRMAVELIDESGALLDVYAGRIEQAAYKVRKVWASMPDAPYGQPTKESGQLVAQYQAEGGQVA